MFKAFRIRIESSQVTFRGIYINTRQDTTVVLRDVPSSYLEEFISSINMRFHGVYATNLMNRIKYFQCLKHSRKRGSDYFI